MFLLFGSKLFGQNIGDYGTITTISGNWSDPTIWGVWDGSAFTNDGTCPPNPITTNVYVGDSASVITINASNDISGTGSAKLIITPNCTMSMGSYAINGGTSSTNFPAIELLGILTTANYVNGGNLIIKGKFSTSYQGTEGWWYSTNRPAQTTYTGSIEYVGLSPTIAGGITYYNLLLNATGTMVLSNDITVNASISISSGTVDLNGKTITIFGNLAGSTGTLKCNNSNIYFRKAGTGQFFSFTGTLSGSFNSLNIGASSGTNGTTFQTSDTIITNSLNITNGTLSISSTNKTQVTGTFSNTSSTSPGLWLKSLSNGTASLIISGSVTNAGTTRMERYATLNAWHNITPAVTGQSIDNSFIINNSIPSKGTATPYTYGMEYYDETAGGWTYYTDNNIGGTFIPGTGYMLRRTSSGAFYFIGTVITGNVTTNITRTHNGWNSVGNPYTSSIGANAGTTSTNFLTYNSGNLDPSHAAIYLWNGTSYTILSNASAATYIQPGQGFIVQAIDNSSRTVNFTPSMQAHANPTFYKKSGQIEWKRMLVVAATATDTSSTQLAFRQDMTKGLDITYDAGTFGGNPALKMYSLLVEDNSVQFGIQCLPDNDTSDLIIPLGIDCSNGGDVTFAVNYNELPQGYKPVLEDRDLATFTDLSQPGSAYQVTLPAGTTGTGRFFLHTRYATTGIHPNLKQKVYSYAANHQIFISGLPQEASRAKLFDLTGRELLDVSLNSSDLHTIDANQCKDGIYILELSGNNFYLTSKIFIH